MERRTKIVATIGPASRDPEVLVRMVEAGMDVARLNFSHGTAELHAISEHQDVLDTLAYLGELRWPGRRLHPRSLQRLVHRLKMECSSRAAPT